MPVSRTQTFTPRPVTFCQAAEAPILFMPHGSFWVLTGCSAGRAAGTGAWAAARMKFSRDGMPEGISSPRSQYKYSSFSTSTTPGIRFRDCEALSSEGKLATTALMRFSSLVISPPPRVMTEAARFKCEDPLKTTIFSTGPLQAETEDKSIKTGRERPTAPKKPVDLRI